MGCCEVHSSANYLSANTLHPPILLKGKRDSSQSKRVRFEISFTKYKNLTIQQAEAPFWYSSILETDFSIWSKYNNSTFTEIFYCIDQGKLFTVARVGLAFEINHETIICLINNPKYRLAWDLSIRKMEVLFGDCNQDALIEVIEMGSDSPRLYERKVRKFAENICCYYFPHKDDDLENYFLISMKKNNMITVYFKEDAEKDCLPLVNQKLLWTTRLFEEVLIYKKN